MFKYIFLSLMLSVSSVMAQTGPGPVIPSTVGTAIPGQIPGTSSNDSASAGNIGEIISSNVAGPGSSLTTATPTDFTTLSLTPGDWDVTGSGCFVPDSTTAVTSMTTWANLTSATLPTDAGSGGINRGVYGNAVLGNVTACLPFGPLRVSVSVPTTVYCSQRSGFSVSTMNALYGFCRARRVR